MTIWKHNETAMANSHTLCQLLAEALLDHGVSTIRVHEETVYDLAAHHVTIMTYRDPETDSWIIQLRDRKHQSEYVEYEIVKDPEVLPPPQRLLPP